MDIAFGPLLMLTALAAVPYLLLSLTDRRGLGVRVGQGLAAGAARPGPGAARGQRPAR